MKPHKYVYCIFYVERDYCDRINSDLSIHGYSHLKAIIPTVQILKKLSKGKMVFEEEPLLFDYGFMRMSAELAYSRPYLNKLRKAIPGIRAWLKDTITLHPRKKRIRIDNAEDFDDFSIVATCSRSEVLRFKRISKENQRFSVDDLVNVQIGDYLVLKGYPYEGIDATVLEVDHINKRVKVQMYPELGRMEVWLPFDHVIYSVYQNYNPDKLYANQFEVDPNSITSESIDNFLDLKTY